MVIRRASAAFPTWGGDTLPPFAIFGCPCINCNSGLVFMLLALELFALPLFQVAFVLIMATLATVPTGDGTREVVLMGNFLPIFGVLRALELQAT